MSTIARGRVIKAEAGDRVQDAKLLVEGPSDEQRIRIDRDEVEAHRSADRIVHEAAGRAVSILEHAKQSARDAAAVAAKEAAEAEQAKLAAAYLVLKAEDERRAELDLDRAIDLAKLLAERVVGAAIELDSAVVAQLAKQALAEARGARRVRIKAHPLDADALRAHLAEVGLVLQRGASIDVSTDEALARGSLRVHTELGTLNAELEPRLDRLAAALRDALGPA